MAKKIGIFGGTFDPIHNAHLLMAQAALEKLDLDKVYFVPCRQPPHNKIPKALPHDRGQLVCAALQGAPRFDLSLIEMVRGDAPSYSVDTVSYFSEELHPCADLYLIMGSDEFLSFGSWKEPEEISRLVTIVVLQRGENRVDFNRGFPSVPLHRGIRIIDDEAYNWPLSSTAIRDKVAKGESIRYLVPEIIRPDIEILYAKPEPIKFTKEHWKYGVFSNFDEVVIEIGGLVYPSTEHYYQAMKFMPHDPEWAEQIRLAATPGKAKKMGNSIEHQVNAMWDDPAGEPLKEAVMRVALKAKFTQNEIRRDILLHTGDVELVEYTPWGDYYWGDGGDGTGKNRLGVLLMELRDELRKMD